MGPKKGLGIERRLGGQLEVQTIRKLAVWVSRRESCLRFLCLVFQPEKMGIPGSEKPTAVNRTAKHNQTEILL